MYVQCERCKTEYDFDDALVSERGTTVKCTQCGHQFKVRRAAAPDGGADRWVVTTVLVVTCAVWVDPQSFKLDSSPSSARVGSTAASMACTASWAFAVSIKPGCTDLVWVWGGW